MSERLKLLAVFAHPDDESMAIGGTLARYAAEGVETFLVMATRGERGWTGDPQDFPGAQALGQIREAELLAAARVLGIRDVSFLDYLDGDLDQADSAEVVAKLVQHFRRLGPQVVVTFAPDGGYGHPDHIAISQFASAAAVCASDPAYLPGGLGPHRVSKLYYYVATKQFAADFQSMFGDLVITVDEVDRRPSAWQDWATTTRIDSGDHWRTAWRAIACHRSQLPGYRQLAAMPEETHRRLWGPQHFYRAFSTVNGGRRTENDLFEGLRT